MANQSAKPVSAKDSPEELTLKAKFAQFQVVRSRLMRRAFQTYPMFVAICIIVDYASGNKYFSKKPDILTGYITAAATSAAFYWLWPQVGATLRRLRERGAILETAGSIVAPMPYSSFLRRFEDVLNHRGSFVLGAVVLLFQARLNPDTDLYGALANPAFYGSAWLFRVILGLVTWFFLGLIVWRLLGIAYLAVKLPREYHLLVQPSHPDNSGGLQPLGELYLRNAVVIAHPGFLLPDIRNYCLFDLHIVIEGWRSDVVNSAISLFQNDNFFAASLLFTVLAVSVSLAPIYHIHQEMLKQSDRHREQLDALAEEIIRLNQELLAPSDEQANADAKTKLDALSLKARSMKKSEPFPAWPLNLNILSKLALAWLLPVLNFLGFSTPVRDAFSDSSEVLRFHRTNRTLLSKEAILCPAHRQPYNSPITISTWSWLAPDSVVP